MASYLPDEMNLSDQEINFDQNVQRAQSPYTYYQTFNKNAIIEMDNFHPENKNIITWKLNIKPFSKFSIPKPFIECHQIKEDIAKGQRLGKDGNKIMNDKFSIKRQNARMNTKLFFKNSYLEQYQLEAKKQIQQKKKNKDEALFMKTIALMKVIDQHNKAKEAEKLKHMMPKNIDKIVKNKDQINFIDNDQRKYFSVSKAQNKEMNKFKKLTSLTGRESQEDTNFTKEFFDRKNHSLRKVLSSIPVEKLEKLLLQKQKNVFQCVEKLSPYEKQNKLKKYIKPKLSLSSQFVSKFGQTYTHFPSTTSQLFNRSRSVFTDRPKLLSKSIHNQFSQTTSQFLSGTPSQKQFYNINSKLPSTRQNSPKNQTSSDIFTKKLPRVYSYDQKAYNKNKKHFEFDAGSRQDEMNSNDNGLQQTSRVSSQNNILIQNNSYQHTQAELNNSNQQAKQYTTIQENIDDDNKQTEINQPEDIYKEQMNQPVKYLRLREMKDVNKTLAKRLNNNLQKQKGNYFVQEEILELVQRKPKDRIQDILYDSHLSIFNNPDVKQKFQQKVDEQKRCSKYFQNKNIFNFNQYFYNKYKKHNIGMQMNPSRKLLQASKDCEDKIINIITDLNVNYNLTDHENVDDN